MKKSSSGFTLIELLIVIAIIGILSSIVIASLTTARQKGKAAAVKKAMTDLLTQGQLYYDDNGNYAVATTSSRVGCFASSTFLTDGTFFGERIPSLMVLNIEENGAPISCAISTDGGAFSMIAYVSGGKYLCRDSDSNMFIEESVQNTTGRCTLTAPAQPAFIPVFANNGGNLTPSTVAAKTIDTVSFQFTGNNQTRTYSCTNGGPSFTLGPSNTLFEYTFTTPGSYFCKRTSNGGNGTTITVTP